ncbi:phospholipid scramblase 2-like isoform X2 [Siniperca chuatsi]|uniref:phospholipid scramblase 2-like isoform X2 n=1 Tax=Siniperca chuatsi TaxID=119488 RepID=UPI001CE0ED4C|nr:phospholipid scramblase 2-like isoform X2 [Siniperca chuatsi]XP_044039254.1 phospholipid scramblase 2-like isoform X2 [Siniperca chuatsi]XP_044039255.1 phospholipid scramblase 2-like isoform X2 [Siniperca chuatsi]XP_044039256.1 phospholipid scramblase 2-like isoform X2 [Siniperca chuatsi]XP_044039257.1 phospholipid scramblase 2-like isoform X2 [Siniperca chuatsi]XP_044039258.1 phospholipid scramblase 2-like isoform X2 [Siniperca chuatsi]
MSVPGYPGSPNQAPYPMPQPGGHSVAPYPYAPGGYGEPSQAPPPGFNMGYNPGPAPVMYQPGPVGPSPVPGPEYGGPPGAISPAPVGAPAAVPVGVPLGLEYLTQIDQILIHQKVELLEAFIGFETNNQYEIKNSLGQKIYKAKEKNDCCTRNCCGSLRSFDMKIKDNLDREVIRLIRPFRCVSCWCPCCLQEMEVQAPPGTTIGYVKQDWHPFLPRFSIQGANKETVMKLEGPCFACNCCGDVNFELKGKDSDKPIGRISKQWSGLLKEVFTDTDNFGIQFPLDMDVKMKAVLMGACFLIDFMFFEKVGEANQRSTVFS